MLRIACLATVLLLTGADVADAAMRTAEQAARASARRRSYTPTQTACFVPIFANYAQLNRNNRWVAGGRGRRGDAYRHEVWSRCGVTR